MSLFNALKCWFFRRWYLLTKQYTKEEYLVAESWAKKKDPILEWDQIQEIHFDCDGISVEWFFSKYQKGYYPGAGNIIYPNWPEMQKIFNPKQQDREDFWDENE